MFRRRANIVRGSPTRSPEPIRQTIVHPDDLVLYDEARRCIDAGAYRAGFILAWIAAAEGILGKLRTMATFHAGIGTFVKRFEKEQKAGTAKDADLVIEAASNGLIDATERIQLDAIRELRNQYGHPTSVTPSAADSEFVLQFVTKSVLAKEPLIMHGAARELARRVFTDRHLVPPDEASIVAFTQRRAPLIHIEARPLFIAVLLNGAESSLADPNASVLGERAVKVASEALEVWGDALDNPPWDVDGWQQANPSAAADVFSGPHTWPCLQKEDQDRILSRCLDGETAAVFTSDPSRLLARADQLLEAGLLQRSQEKLVVEAIERTDPMKLVHSSVRFQHVAAVIIRRLEDGNFDVATEGVNALRASDVSKLASVDPHMQYDVGVALAYAANYGTWAAQNDVDGIARSTDRWPHDFRKGVVVGALVGKHGSALGHDATSKAAVNVALADMSGDLALAAVAALPDKVIGLSSPSLVAELRSTVEGSDNEAARSALTEFLDRVENPASDDGGKGGLQNFD